MATTNKKHRNPGLRYVPNYTGLGRKDKDPQNWLVEKANPLQALSETSMTLPEFKILDAYLSRIDSHNDRKRIVRFEKGELEKLLGVTRINNDDLKKRLRNMFQVVELRDPDKPKGFKLIQLFEEADAFQDEDGLWQVDLMCTASSYEYVFNIENRGYLQYRLKNVINLTSRYSYILFLYLDKNRYRKSWDIALSDLKQLLNCIKESYNKFKVFNDRVLKLCFKEINEKTELKYTYEPIRSGRKVTKIRFTVETINDLEEDPDQLSLLDDDPNKPLDLSEQPHEPTDIETEWCNKYSIDCTDSIVFMAAACNFEFTAVQMNEIMEFVRLMTLENSYGTEIARHHYLTQTYARLNTAAERANKAKDPIKHRYNYFLTLVKKDLTKKSRGRKLWAKQ